MAEDRAKRGGGFSRSLDPYEVNVQYNSSAARSSGVVENSGADWFGPLNPMEPTAPPAVIGRQTDYPSGFNLVQQPKAYDTVGFGTLRGLADGYDLLRLIIETRKDQVARLKWNVVPRDPKKRNEGELGDRIKKIEEFFLRPDKQHFWDEWLRMILEDLLVLDAPAIFRRRTNGGELYALDPIDGATIKVVIDDWGRTPTPPTAAYQQVLKGLPAVNYTTKDLIYKPRNVRTWKFYGYSPVEQILMTVNIALRRQVFQLSYFTEGTMPEALIGVPETWTPDQIAQFQTWFDSMLQGNLAERSRARFVPNAVGKTYIQTKEGELFGKAEEWLARVTCFAFSINPQPFVAMMNRATADSAQETAQAEGLAPLQSWIKSLMDTVIIEDFNSPDLMFKWEDEEPLDPAERQKVLGAYTADGLMTFNESRIAMGRDPFVGEMFDKPMFKSSMGWVKIEDGPIQTNAATMKGKDSQTGEAEGPNAMQEEDPADDQEGAAPPSAADPDAGPAGGKWADKMAKGGKYNPDQKRDPGGDDGGQWTKDGGDDDKSEGEEKAKGKKGDKKDDSEETPERAKERARYETISRGQKMSDEELAAKIEELSLAEGDWKPGQVADPNSELNILRDVGFNRRTATMIQQAAQTAADDVGSFSAGDLSLDEMMAIDAYTGATNSEHGLFNSSEGINGVLRGQMKDVDKANMALVEKHVAGLDASIAGSKTTTDLQVFRAGDLPARLKVGDTFKDDGYVSTMSYDPAPGKDKFAAPTGKGKSLYEIRMPAGSNALRIGERGMGGLLNEREVLLPRGSTFKVVQARGKGKRAILEVVLPTEK